jgi:apolipoprotein N-acyltransferase
LSEAGRRYALALAAGVFGSLCWLPTGLTFLYPLYPFLFLRALREVRTGRQAVLVGIVIGASRYLVASHFLLALLRYSPLAIVFYLLATLSILPFSIVWCWGPFRLERLSGISRLLWLSPVYIVMEWLRTVGDLSFPAVLVAHGLGNAPAWADWLPWLGPFGMTLLIFGSGLLLDRAWELRRKVRPALALAGAATVLWLAPAATYLLSDALARPSGEAPLRVAVVQPCLTPEEKLDPRHSPQLWERLEEMTRAAARDADLVILPETARPGWVKWEESGPFADEEMEALSRAVGVPILYGCQIARIRRDGGATLYNGAALVHPDDRPAQWYGKQRLLPFVEGVPFASLLGWDPSARDPKRDSYLTMLGNFTPGPEPTIFEVGEARIGVLVCYEGFYPHLARRYRQEGANMLAVLTNDAWWGRSVFPSWHARMIAARAREAGVPVVRAANNGISSYTDARGRLRSYTALDEITLLRAPVLPARTGPTLYARTGDLLILLSGILIALGIGRAFLRRSS